MSTPTTATQNVAALCRELDVTVLRYAEELQRKAEAEAAFKTARAKRILKARADGDASSMALAETVAEADDVVSALRLDYLITESVAAATKERLAALRERIGFGRSVMTNDREADKLHAAGAGAGL